MFTEFKHSLTDNQGRDGRRGSAGGEEEEEDESLCGGSIEGRDRRGERHSREGGDVEGGRHKVCEGHSFHGRRVPDLGRGICGWGRHDWPCFP